jgi:tyrosine decarboxylase/aspartate 1-decarboxylase
MEKEVVGMLGSLLHLSDPFGHVLSGGTEANITAMYIAKKKSRGRKVIFPRSAHFSVLKAIKLLDMEPIPIDLDDQFRMDLSELDSKIDDDTAMVVGVAGTTELGAVDPISRIGETAGDVHVHVDAAFGGFVLPFLEELGMLDERVGEWDFSVPQVSTLSTDPHKMGWSTIPAGCLLFRDPQPLRYMAVESPYLTSPKAYTLAGTRDSGSVASAYAMMKLLGVEGYTGLVRTCMENTFYLGERLKEIGLEPLMEPVMNILAVGHDEPGMVQDRMRELGFYISKVCNPGALRFVVMPHVTPDSIDRMSLALERVIGRI